MDAALSAVAAVTRELKKAKTGAQRGQLRDLRRALDAAVGRVQEAAQLTADAAGSFDFDDRAHLGEGGYVEELLAEAEKQDVAMFEADGQLLCYPSLIKVVASDAAVEVDRRRERRLRPSLLVGLLAAAQARPPRFRPEPFLESLAGGYDLVRSRDAARPGSVVRLVDIWAVLTLLPNAQKDYARPEFARDLYLLDSSGVATTKSGRVAGWHASTGTKGSGTRVRRVGCPAARCLGAVCRAWINEWDLVRLDPDDQPTTDAVDTPTDYRETPELDGDNADDTGS